MADSGDKRRDEKGLSARYLVLVFLMGVAACAVFFLDTFFSPHLIHPPPATSRPGSRAYPACVNLVPGDAHDPILSRQIAGHCGVGIR